MAVGKGVALATHREQSDALRRNQHAIRQCTASNETQSGVISMLSGNAPRAMRRTQHAIRRRTVSNGSFGSPQDSSTRL